MIYSDEVQALDSEFASLLSHSRQSLKAHFGKTARPVSPSDFERQVYGAMCAMAGDTPFDGTIRHTADKAFPDIVARRFFGVEVKMTQKDGWTSAGNSVRELSRAEDVERIYMLFGKFGGGFDVAVRPYQDCLSEVRVTHSPRYMINMKLAEGASIFDKLGTSYDELRTDPKIISRIRAYYRSQLKDGEELWWLDEEEGTTPIIRSFSSLPEEEKRRLKAEAMLFFPEIFGSSAVKFERVAAYWISEYGVVSAALRDVFTAGGRGLVNQRHTVAQIGLQLHALAQDIKALIRNIDPSRLEYFWRSKIGRRDPLDAWLELLEANDATRGDIGAVEIFMSGLEKEI
ncbi:MAG TPA: hypothetical protein ENJ57_06355 [Rhizobiales bacterium]|nr:hypothetical protein [Hyphomicrobiales bacterium]